MRILLYGINYSPELTGIGKYSGEFARWCAAHGHDVKVITAPPYYPDWKVHDEYSAIKFDRATEGDVRVVRCPLYVPSRPSALKRLLHLASFAFTSSFTLIANLRWKPDLVIQVAPTLFCSPATLVFAKLTKARSVLHIQDFEVDAMLGLDMAGAGALKRLAYAFERSMLTSFDSVSTISPGMIKRAVAKGVDQKKTILFPNWSEIERFQGIVVNDEYIASLGVDRRKKLVLYSGSMGEKQGLGSVLEVASRFQERDDIQFLLVGEGGVKSDLVEECERLQLKNISFAPLQPYDALPMLLAAADCHLVVQKRGAADAMLPSKLTNILAAGGNAVITADPDTSLGELVREWPGIACCVEPESVDALSSGIEQALAMPSPNSIALEYAGGHLEKNAVLTTFLSRFDDLVDSTKVQDAR